MTSDDVASVIDHPALPLGFPLLGPEYPLDSAAAAFNVALLTECFGFGSGLIGYSARKLIDWRVSRRFIAAGRDESDVNRSPRHTMSVCHVISPV